MYVLETRPGGGQMLLDISAKELKESVARWGPEGYSFRRVDASYAHRWVKRGDPHSTDLWTDNQGRIRKAGVGC